MKKRYVTVSLLLAIPETKDDWQLYDMPGSDSVARKLTKALLESLAFPPDQLPMAWKNFEQTQDAYTHYGAADTEPRDVALRVFEQVFGKAQTWGDDRLMPNTPHLPGDRFFARLRTFDLECPSCGAVFIVRLAPVRGGRKVPASTWEDLLQRFHCSACSDTWALGMVAWPIRSGSRLRPAADTIPSPRQAHAIRSQTGGWHLKTRTGSNDPRNVRVTEPCRCKPDTRFVHPACPVHGEVRGNIQAAPQVRKPGSLPTWRNAKNDYEPEEDQ